MRKAFIAVRSYQENLSLRWLLGWRKLSSSKKLELCKWFFFYELHHEKNIIFYHAGKKRHYFPYFPYEIIFYCAELFECVEKMEEIYTAISYHVEKRSAEVTTSGSGNYCCVPKCIKSTQCKVEYNIKSSTEIVFSLSLKS